MSAPTPEILRFRSRLDTLKRGKVPTRARYLKAERRAFRSYLKFIAKDDWPCSKLEIMETVGYPPNYPTIYYRPYNGYTHGYPSFWAPKCAARDSWERQFSRHRDAVETAEAARERAEWEARYQAIERVSTVQAAKHSRFLTLTRAAHAIAHSQEPAAR